MATAATKTPSPNSLDTLLPGATSHPGQAFHKTLRRADHFSTLLPSPEQMSYHSDCLKKSLLARYPQSTSIITSHFAYLNSKKPGAGGIEQLSTKLSTLAITPLEDPEKELSCTPHHYFHPDVMNAISAAVPLLLRDMEGQKPAHQPHIEAAVLLALVFLGSIQFAHDDFCLSDDDFDFYLNTLSQPAFTETLKQDWPIHVQLCEYLFDSYHYMLHRSPPETRSFETDKAHARRLLAFEQLEPARLRSQKKLGEQYIREFKLHLKLEAYPAAFQCLQQAEQVGNFECYFELACIYLGLRDTADKFVNLDRGIQFLGLSKQTAPDFGEDTLMQLQEEDNIRNLDTTLQIRQTTKGYNYVDSASARIAADIHVTVLKRYIGIDCQKDPKLSYLLLNTIKNNCKLTHQRVYCLLKCLEGQITRKPTCTELPAIERHWLLGKFYESNQRYNEALDCYQKAAKLKPFVAGWAPVRIATQLQRWDIALALSQALFATWPDEHAQSDRELLLDTIANLAGLVATQEKAKQEEDLDALTAWIAGDGSTSSKTGKKKKRRKKQISPSTALLPPAIAESAAAPKTNISLPQRVSSLSAGKNIRTQPVTDKLRQLYRTNRQLASIAITNGQFAEADRLICQMTNTSNHTYQARKTQIQCWLMLRQSSNTRYLQEQAGTCPVAKKTLQTDLRSQVETQVIESLATLLELNGDEKMQLQDDPEAVLETLNLSAEVQCAAASLLSVLGHCYLDIYHTYPWLSYLKDKKKRCFDCADKTNPWRLDIKAGKPLSDIALAAMNF